MDDEARRRRARGVLGLRGVHGAPRDEGRGGPVPYQPSARLVVVAPAPEAEKSNAPVADSSASVESETADPLQGRAHVRSPPTLAALGTFVVLVVALASYLTARVATARRVDGGYDGVKLLCFEMSFDWRFQGNGEVERWEDDWTEAAFDPGTHASDDGAQVGDTGIANLNAQIIRRRLREGATKHDAAVTTLWGTHLCTVPALEPYDLWFLAIEMKDDDDDDERRLDTEEDPNDAEVVRLLLGMSYSYEYSYSYTTRDDDDESWSYAVPWRELETRYFNVKSLKLRELGIKEFDLDCRAFVALQTLDLHSNALASLPESFGGLSSLVTLYLQDNALASLPESFGGLASLVRLELHDNALASLPESFGDLASVVSVDLDNNALESLPESFSDRLSLGTAATAPAARARSIRPPTPTDVANQSRA